MSNVTVQEALKAALAAIDLYDYTGTQAESEKFAKAERLCKAALSDLDKCEPVAEAIRERDRLGFAVVNVIGKLDEIIENTQEVEIDDFLHIAVPIDMWNELQDALEDMPKRADLYTSPQPIEKCEPVGWYCKACKETGLSHCSDPENCGGMVRTYTSPQPIEKCEPVGELILDPAFLPALKSPLVNWKINLVDLEVGTKFFTSPQPRDWVGLSESSFSKLASTYYPSAHALTLAVEAELKQLNTKG